MHQLVEDVVIFHALSEEQFAILKPYLIKKQIKQGQWVVREGQDADCMYVIGKGRVSIWKRRGRLLKGDYLGVLKKGDCFGEMCLIDCQARSASILAETSLEVLVLPYMAMLDLYEKHPRLYSLLIINIAREISRRLRLNEQVLTETRIHI